MLHGNIGMRSEPSVSVGFDLVVVKLGETDDGEDIVVEWRLIVTDLASRDENANRGISNAEGLDIVADRLPTGWMHEFIETVENDQHASFFHHILNSANRGCYLEVGIRTFLDEVDD